MKTTRKIVTKKSRGRPPTGTGIQVGERWSPEALARIDDWRRQQADLPGRPEAIRRLVEIGLSKTLEQPRVLSTSRQSAARAVELAAKAIDKRIDPAAPPAEREVRKRKLIQGPSPFRDSRKDRPGK
jgi:hypothetical protein